LGKESFICSKYNKTSSGTSAISNETGFNFIRISKIYLFLFVILSAIIIFLYLKGAQSISEEFGGGRTWVEKMATYRYISAIAEDTVDVPAVISWPFQFIIMTGYVFIYVVINNYMLENTLNYKLIALTLILMFVSALSASRNHLIRYPLFTLVIYYLLWRKKEGWKRMINFEYIIQCLLFLVFVLILFSVARVLVGRTSESTLLLYLAQYVGSPIQLLDMYLQTPDYASGILDLDSFRGVNNFLYRWFNNLDVKHTPPPSLYSDGVYLGNAFGIFKRYIHDFGYSSAFIMPAISSAIYSALYRCCRISTRNTGNNIRPAFIIFIFSYITYGVFLQFYGHDFFGNVLVMGEIKNIFFMYISLQIFAGRR
jgi:oligosaccharide repeat unit polymerase